MFFRTNVCSLVRCRYKHTLPRCANRPEWECGERSTHGQVADAARSLLLVYALHFTWRDLIKSSPDRHASRHSRIIRESKKFCRLPETRNVLSVCVSVPQRFFRVSHLQCAIFRRVTHTAGRETSVALSIDAFCGRFARYKCAAGAKYWPRSGGILF